MLLQEVTLQELTMTARISSRRGDEITIEIKVRLSVSILEREEQILEGLNKGGNVATEEMLKDLTRMVPI